MTSPINDDYVDSYVLSGHIGAVIASNVEADTEPGEPAPGAGSGDASIWFTWTAQANGTLTAATLTTFDTFGSRTPDDKSLDTVLGVFTGSDLAALVEVDTSDDSGDSPDPINPDTGGTTSKVSFLAVPGTTYHVRVTGYDATQTGAVILRWHQRVFEWGPNLLTGDDAGFESSLGNWVPHAAVSFAATAVTQSTDQAHSGAASMKITGPLTTSPAEESAWGELVGVAVSDTLPATLRCWVRAVGGQVGSQADLEYDTGGGGSTEYSTGVVDVDVADGWVQLEILSGTPISGNVPPAGATGVVNLALTGQVNDVLAGHFDDVELLQAAAAPDIPEPVLIEQPTPTPPPEQAEPNDVEAVPYVIDDSPHDCYRYDNFEVAGELSDQNERARWRWRCVVCDREYGKAPPEKSSVLPQTDGVQ